MPDSTLQRYIIVGSTAYLFEMATLYGLRIGLGFSPLKSVAISFWVGFIVAFLLQKIVTFKNHEKHARAIAKQLAGYSLLVGWNYGFTLVSVRLLSGTLSVFVIRTLVIMIITSWNFVLYRILFK